MSSGSSSACRPTCADRLYLRIFDPEPAGAHDTRYGRSADATSTLFRLSGGEGAYSGAPAAGGGRGRRAAGGPDPAAAGFAGGRVHRRAPLRRGEPHRRRLGDARAVHRRRRRADRRPRLLPARRDRRGRRLRQRLHRRGEPVARPLRPGAGRARSSPTSRPSAGARAATRPRCASTRRRARRSRLQSFDGAEGEIALVSTFGERAPARPPARTNGGSPPSTAPGGTAAITLRGGTETPERRDPRRSSTPTAAPVALEMPPRPAPAAAAPEAVASARPLANCTSVAFDASASTGDGPLAYRWRFGDGGESDAPVIAHPFAEPGRYEAELEVLGARRPGRPRRARRGAGARARRAGGRRRRPGDRRARRAGRLRRRRLDARATARSPASTGASATAPRPRAPPPTHAYERPGLYRAVLRVEDDSGHPCDFGVATRDRHRELPAGRRGRRGARRRRPASR